MRVLGLPTELHGGTGVKMADGVAVRAGQADSSAAVSSRQGTGSPSNSTSRKTAPGACDAHAHLLDPRFPHLVPGMARPSDRVQCSLPSPPYRASWLRSVADRRAGAGLKDAIWSTSPSVRRQRSAKAEEQISDRGALPPNSQRCQRWCDRSCSR